MPDALMPIAVLVMAYGGPDSLEEVEPYLLDVRQARPLGAETLQEVESRYAQIGGRSPLRERTEEQVRALERALEKSHPGQFKLFMGMRHWHPYIAEAVDKIRAQGIKRAVGLVMAPHYSRMSVGAYFDRTDEAVADGGKLEIARITSWKADKGYLETLEARLNEALQRFPPQKRGDVKLIFTAHSLPERILEWDDPYPEELQRTFGILKARFPENESHFAYQSAAMTPEAWLGPDAGELMLALIDQGARDFLIAPIGFVSEHVEILYDIDIDFRQQVEAAGGRLERIEMPGADLGMMESLAEVVAGKAAERGWI
ncbi:MAG: ferrochelatase [Anaerolineales bacterium]|nr:ferrochelatase [Anaerolineales bacterium]